MTDKTACNCEVCKHSIEQHNAPAMLFYVQDFLADPHVASQPNEWVGMYVRLLCYTWIDGCLPNNDKQLAALTSSGKRFCRFAQTLRDRFCSAHCKQRGRVLYHERVNKERAKLLKIKTIRSEAASRRWHANAYANADAKAMQNDANQIKSNTNTKVLVKGGKTRTEREAFRLQSLITEKLVAYGASKDDVEQSAALHHMMCQYLPERVILAALASANDAQMNALDYKRSNGKGSLVRLFAGVVRSICADEGIQSPIHWKA